MKKLQLTTCVAALMAVLTLSAHAQAPSGLGAPTQVKVKVGAPAFELLTTPEYEYSGALKKKTPRSREWLEIEVPFETASDSSIGMVNQLTFVYYVAVQVGNVASLLRDQFTYINIPDKDEMYASIYISPTALARLSGGMGKFDKGAIRTVGVEVLFNGRVIYPENPAEAWWTRGGANMPSPQAGVVLPKERTPFRMLWIDRHVELQQQ